MNGWDVNSRTNQGLSEMQVLPSSISRIDPAHGIFYRKYELENLYTTNDFDEVTYILWNNERPTQEQLLDFKNRKVQLASLSEDFKRFLSQLPEIMSFGDKLQMALSFMGHEQLSKGDFVNNIERDIYYLAQMESTVAYLCRRPNQDCGHQGFLDQYLDGKLSPQLERLFNQIRILYAEHELNAATFACRVAASTEVSEASCLVTAFATLRGAIHGGAIEGAAAHYTATDLKSIESNLINQLALKQKIMGFGHRVYMKTGDPRYPLMKNTLANLATELEETRLIEACQLIEKTVRDRIGIKPNLDLAGAACFLQLGFAKEEMVPLIAMSRIVGWLAHTREQQKLKKIIRPRAFWDSQGESISNPLL